MLFLQQDGSSFRPIHLQFSEFLQLVVYSSNKILFCQPLFPYCYHTDLNILRNMNTLQKIVFTDPYFYEQFFQNSAMASIKSAEKSNDNLLVETLCT